MSVENSNFGYVSFRFTRESYAIRPPMHIAEDYFVDFKYSAIDAEAGVAYILVSSNDTTGLNDHEEKLRQRYGVQNGNGNQEPYTGLCGMPELLVKTDPGQEWIDWKRV